ncbi:MAG: DUF1302 family protein [Nitrospirota bacterium]
MMRAGIYFLLLLYTLFIPIHYSLAEEADNSMLARLMEDIEIDGYIENETAFRINNPQRFRKVQNLLQIETRYQTGDIFELYGLIWLMYDAAYDIERDSFNEETINAYQTNLRFKEVLRELYLEIDTEMINLRIGRQQVVWGEAVGLRITDLINPQDFKEFILDDFIDSRIPLWMIRLEHNTDDLTIEALFIPDFEPNIPARSGSEWEMKSPPPDPDITIIRNDTIKPEDGLHNSEWGLRVSDYVAGWDISGIYFYTWDDTPTLHANRIGNKMIISPEHHRIHNMGFTFNNAFGRAVIMGELSYNIGRYFQTSSQNDPDGVVKKDFIFYMLGSDYTVSENLLINLQFIQRYILNHDKGLLEDRIQNIYSILLNTDFINETLKPSLLAIYDSNNKGLWIRPEIKYDYNDNTKLTIGADILEGDKGLLGQFDNNDRIFVEVKYSL